MNPRLHLRSAGALQTRTLDGCGELVCSRAELDEVDGIPEGYFEANGTYEMTAEQRVEWEAEVRSLYNGMVRIVVTPTWAELIDFETTLSTAVEEPVQQREERQRS